MSNKSNKKQKKINLIRVSLILIFCIMLYINEVNTVHADTKNVTCNAGEYYEGQGKCSQCPVGYYCPGGSFFGGDSSRGGINECPDGTTSKIGADSKSDCISETSSEITCEAGEYYEGQGKCSQCPVGYYCPGGTYFAGDSSREGINECPVGTTSEIGANSKSDCTTKTGTVGESNNKTENTNKTSMEVCTNPEILRVLYFFNIIIDIVKIIVPICLIIYGLIDFSKAVISSDEKEQKKTVNLFVKRILYGVLIFIVPWIVETFMITLGNLLDKKNMGNFTDCIENANSECIDALDSKNKATISSVCDVPEGFLITGDSNSNSPLNNNGVNSGFHEAYK